jgi:PD-(D/E)XK nuclease superfamily protein
MTSRTLILPKHLLKVAEKEAPDSERRPTAPHLSYSQLSMYLRCSMQYYFRYIQGLKERPKVSTSIGKGGHAALEWNTRSKLITGRDRPADEIVAKASDLIDHYLADVPPSEYEADVEPGALKDKQLAATRVYAVRDAPGIIPVGAEVEYDLDINKYVPDQLRQTRDIRPINMKIDVIYQDRLTLVQDHDQGVAIGIEDYKYVTRKKTQAEVNMSPQLTTYATAMRDLTGRWPTKLGIRMMHPGSMAAKPKPSDPAPDSIPLLREPEHMTPEAMTRRMTRVAYQFAEAERGIREGIFIPVDDPITCSWCGFRDRCQASLVDDFEAARIRETTTPR